MTRGKAIMIGRSCPLGTTSALFVAILLALTFASTPANAECLVSELHDSSAPSGITLVGMTGGVVDPRGQFIVIVRDLASNPVPNCEVMIDFGECDPDIRVATNQPQPGHRVECDANGTRVFATTDANGRVEFRIVGAANAAAGGPAAGFNCATMRAGAANFGRINVAAFDLDGGGGTTAADVSLFLTDFFDADYEARSDYDHSNLLSAADLSILLQGVLGSGSTQSGVNYCL